MIASRAFASLLAFSLCAAVMALAPTTAHAADTTPPDPPIVTGPSGTVASTSANISVAPAAAGDIVQCWYNGEEVNCPGSWTIHDLEQGPHTVTAQSSDAAGNYSTTAYVYWKVDTVGPVPTVVAPTSLTNYAYVSFNENVTGVTASSVKVRTLDGDPVPVTRACVTLTNESTPCGSSNVRKVRLTPDTGSWVLGESYRVTTNDTGSATVADAWGNVAALANGTFDAPTHSEELGATHSWRTVTNAKASGGSFVVDRRAGASAVYTFSGSSLTWVTVTGPSHGRAELYIDGSLRGTFNNYSAKQAFDVKRTVSGLGAGQHTAEVRVLGRKGNRAANDKLVAVDGFIAGGSVDGTPSLTERWSRVYAAAASNGYYSVADLAGARASMAFAGESVTVHSAVGPKFGEAEVYVDGSLERTVDLYAPALSFGHEIVVNGLSSGQHTVVVKVLGSKAPASGGTGVVVDAISAG